MAGISRYGAYVPIHRLGAGTAGWTGGVERAVANFDEDSITMAVAAVRDLLRGQRRDDVDALYVASTTLPYEEKQAATLVALASDLPERIYTTDVGHSVRAGTIALQMALDAVAAGRLKKAVVVAADSRLGMPGSDFEKAGGDGAVAFLIEPNGRVATRGVSAAVSNEVYDTFRPSGQNVVQSWEERFVQDEGYLESVQAVVGEVVSRQGRALKSFTKVALTGNSNRRHAEAVRLLQLPKEQVAEPLFEGLGNTGGAAALMQLANALDGAKPGDSILVVNYGDGAEAVELVAGAGLPALQKEAGRRGLRGYLASKIEMGDYAEYLRWRGFLSADSGVRRPSGSGPSAAALHREREEVLQFHGVRCRACATIQYPPQRICGECGKTDQLDPVRLADERAKVFTYSMDYIAGTQDVPLVLTVLDFDIGGRAVLMMTDRRVEQMAIDLPLELTFRQARSGGGIQNYYWKCMPVRDGAAKTT